jgi:hypothetical protein
LKPSPVNLTIAWLGEGLEGLFGDGAILVESLVRSAPGDLMKEGIGGRVLVGGHRQRRNRGIHLGSVGKKLNVDAMTEGARADAEELDEGALTHIDLPKKRITGRQQPFAIDEEAKCVLAISSTFHGWALCAFGARIA